MTESTTLPVHLSVLLDRSGSMQVIADDVIGGFNQLLADQRAAEGTVRVSLAQFDGNHPFEMLIDAVDLREVTDLDRSRYQPRGSTPLFDGVGRMIATVDGRIAAAADRGGQPEDQVVVIITDGAENASRELTRDAVFAMIEDRRQRGWAFVFLGANQDAYAEGGRLGMSRGATAGWDNTADGTQAMWAHASRSVAKYREKDRMARMMSTSRFLEQDDQDRPETPWGRLAEPGIAPPIPHSYWVLDGRLAAGAYPFHGLPELAEGTLAALIDAGVTAFVDLTEPGAQGSDRFAVRYREALARLAPEAVVVSHPITDMSVPSRAAAAATLDAIDGFLGAGHTVYVHCLAGIGRTGTLIGCWLIRHEAAAPDSVLDVLAGLRQTGGDPVSPSPQTAEQERFVKRWSPGH